jgi:hypothetical protein
MVPYVKRWLLAPAIIPIGVSIVVAILIIGIGEILLALVDPDAEKDSLARPELLFAMGLSVVFLAACAFIATRPKGSTGALEADRVIGGPFLAPPPPPLDVRMRSGREGTVEDVVEGYTLYARNGPLARVLGIVPGSEEYGRRFSGYLYATGLYGASAEMWVPFEAVIAVYPDTRSAFLSIKGDETEHFGWTNPPLSVSRRAPRPEGPKGL